MKDGFVSRSGDRICDPAGNPLLLHGVGIGMWLVPEGYMFDQFGGPFSSPRGFWHLAHALLGPDEGPEFQQAWYKSFFAEEDIAAIARDGFDSVRLPLEWSMLFSHDADLRPNQTSFAILDQTIALCAKHGLWVMLDLHCAPGGQTGANIDDSLGYPWLWESPTCRRMTVEIWRYIAARYATNTAVLGYDLLNEPIPRENEQYNHLLEPLYKEITAAIRGADTNHLVFLEGAHYATNFSVFSEPFDDKSVYTFHKYWNPNTTHEISPFLTYRDRYGVPILCSETGESNSVPIREWYEECASLFATHEIGWNFWTYKRMGPPKSPYTIRRPTGWDEVVEYTRSGKRPSIEASRQAFAQLLENTRHSNLQRNDACIDAWLKSLPHAVA